MTPNQIQLARHALGLPNRQRLSYRNYFCTGPGPGCSDFEEWQAMVAAGWAHGRKGNDLTGGDHLFVLTLAGATLALRKGERLAIEAFRVILKDPQPVKLSRAKGWRMPAHTVSVARPGPWGNPFKWQVCVHASPSRDQRWAKGTAVDMHREWLRHPERYPELPPPPSIKTIKHKLRGQNLACWCGLDEPCHRMTLLELANS